MFVYPRVTTIAYSHKFLDFGPLFLPPPDPKKGVKSGKRKKVI